MGETILNKIVNVLNSVPLGDWRFHGFLADRIDAWAGARVIPDDAWQKIYPETEEAFRQREDDTSHPGRGEWRGEFWGKYILSVIAACRYYSSEKLKQRVAEAVKGLLSTQDANGYIGTYRDSAFHGLKTWNIWGRKYTLWGLLEAWELLGDDSILQAACRFTDHLMQEVGPGRHDIVQTGQFYGLPSTSILTPIVMLYRATNNRKYLDYAEYIVDQWSRHPQGLPDLLRKGLAGKPIHEWFDDPYHWAKSYEFVSCVEGLLALYRVTGTKDYLAAAQNIHSDILDWERSFVGSMSFNDKFVGSRFLLNTVAEICDAVYWNRLSYELFLLSGEERYLGEIERTLYNTLLCGMSPDGTWGLRRLRCTHEHIPAHNHFLKHHQCCVDNLPRGWFQAAESAVFTDREGLRIGLYQAGEGQVKLAHTGNAVRLAVTGDFLQDGRVHIELTPEQAESFDVRLRIPAWSRRTTVQVNGETWGGESAKPGSWFVIHRLWAPGDRIDLQLDVAVYAEYFDANYYNPDDERVAWHEKAWAAMGFIGEDDRKVAYSRGLSKEQALPHRRAAMFFTGPLALAQDVRLGAFEMLKPLPDDIHIERCTLTAVNPPVGIWRAYELDTGSTSGEKLKLCDFASAGNTWDERSLFSAWKLLN
jgi:DUF1680 family protein